jgi:serine/threonine protein kinase
VAPLKAGRYQLLEELGRGAMGVVYRAFDPVIGRNVAVKTLRLNAGGSGMSHAELLNRFQTEARAAGSLTHPNIVSVYDAGEDEGLFYITMEHVDGPSLQERLDQKQIFPLPRILKLMEQACSALGTAHQHNVIHRDIKPANMILTADDTLKITDFGTAKIMQLGTTQSGHIVGTPSYMSPEQVKGKLVDGRSDLFSLGVILYELITGEKPFPGQNVTTVIYKIVNIDPIPPRELDSSIPSGLNFIVTKTLSKDPGSRYATCQEFWDALQNYGNIESNAEDTVKMARLAPAHPAPAQSPPPMRRFEGNAPSRSPQPPAQQNTPVYPFTSPPPAAAPLQSKPQRSSHGYLGGIVLLLVVIIAGGGVMAWPNLHDGLRRIRADLFGSAPGASSTTQGTTQAATNNPAPPPAEPPVDVLHTDGAAPATTNPPVQPTSNSVAGTTAPATEPDLTQEQSQVQKQLERAGLSKKVRVEIAENGLSVSGTLTRSEHEQLLKQLRGLPTGLAWKDRTQIARASTAAPDSPDEEGKPRTASGKGEVEVLTDVMGARAVLQGPDGKANQECKTPCRFEDLLPGRYTMEVNLAGYQIERRILEVRAGSIVAKEISLQPLRGSIVVVTQPAGADIYINGQRRAQQSPAEITLPPGNYSIRVQKAGYRDAEKAAALEADQMLQWSVTLPPVTATASTDAWVNVKTVPPGADVVVNGKSMGQRSPALLKLPPGQYVLTLYLRGYKAIQKTIVVNASQVQDVNEVLAKP